MSAVQWPRASLITNSKKILILFLQCFIRLVCLCARVRAFLNKNKKIIIIMIIIILLYRFPDDLVAGLILRKRYIS